MSSFNSAAREVVAHRWFNNGDHPNDGPPDREGQVVRRFRHPNIGDGHRCSHCDRTMNVHGWIDADANGRTVCPGDWIITTATGDRYPCKPDLFEAMYPQAQGLGPALHTPYTFSHAVDDARAVLQRAEQEAINGWADKAAALRNVADGFVHLGYLVVAEPSPVRFPPTYNLVFNGSIREASPEMAEPRTESARSRRRTMVPTVICALNRAEGEAAAAEARIPLPHLVWADTRGYMLQGIDKPNLFVTEGFHQHLQAAEIWDQVRKRLHLVDLPESPPTEEFVVFAREETEIRE